VKMNNSILNLCYGRAQNHAIGIVSIMLWIGNCLIYYKLYPFLKEIYASSNNLPFTMTIYWKYCGYTILFIAIVDFIQLLCNKWFFSSKWYFVRNMFYIIASLCYFALIILSFSVTMGSKN
jgi:hypothetical protein